MSSSDASFPGSETLLDFAQPFDVTVLDAVVTTGHLAQAVFADAALTVCAVVAPTGVRAGIAIFAAAIGIGFVAIEGEIVTSGTDAGSGAEVVVELAGPTLTVVGEVTELIVPAGVTVSAAVHIRFLTIEPTVVAARCDAP